jgi:probable F420-dependent oxidoreductase
MDFTLAPIGIWTHALDVVPLSRSQELAAELEELGYGAVWLPEVAGRDIILHMGMLLTATDHLVAASGIANIWARDAVTMTGGIKGLTEAFPERALLGLGVSHQPLVEDLRGHDYRKPLAAMRAYLDAMDNSPYQAQRPDTPVRRVLAALGPKMLALAAEKTEGAHSYFVTPEHTASAREVLGANRLLCPEQAVVLETDPARAREIGRTHTKTYVRLPNYQNNLRRHGFGDEDFADGGSDRLIDAIVAWGDEATVVDRVKQHFDAGADHVCVQVIIEDQRSAPEEGWRTLAPALTELGRSVKPAS